MSKGMKVKDIKFLYGKGDICRFCKLISCARAHRIRKHAEKEEGIYNLSLQIFACDYFKRKEG